MYEATVCNLVRTTEEGVDETLLGKRMSLFRNGIWSGPGGKFKHPREKPLTCLARETKEEIGIKIDRDSAVQYATVDFYHPYKSELHLEWRVHFFTVTKWNGEPSPVEGFSELKWFPRKKLPFDIMMPCQRVWVPITNNFNLPGRVLMANINYADKDGKVVDSGEFKFVPVPLKT